MRTGGLGLEEQEKKRMKGERKEGDKKHEINNFN